MSQTKRQVLIETYWNVKPLARTDKLCRLSGINRNILECKARKWYSISDLNCCINRNILECKAYNRRANRQEKSEVLIETYWNVKLCGISLSEIRQSRINRNILECKG